MTAIVRSTVDIAGQAVSLLRGGPERDPVLFLHGGVPGRTPYCGGAHLWADYLPLPARERHVLAPDLPGFGDTAAGDQPHRIDGAARLALALIEAAKLGPCHVVGHDEGGLIAIAMALAAPSAVRSISIVASPTAAPTGDSIENLTLANPPLPHLSRAAQAWALERLSHDRSHIDGALLDRCVACAEGPAHRRALALAASGNAFAASAAKTRGEFYATCRERAFPAAVQIVWGRNDPLTTIEHGRVLFGVVAAHQRAAHFHLINRAGSFPFREEPLAFDHVVAAFHDALPGA